MHTEKKRKKVLMDADFFFIENKGKKNLFFDAYIK